MKRAAKGYTLIEVIVVVVIVGVLAAVAIPVYSSYVTSAQTDKARGNCELIAAAVAQQHYRGIGLSGSSFVTLGITDPADANWIYTFQDLAASAALNESYYIQAASAKYGTWKLYPKKSGATRWVKQ